METLADWYGLKDGHEDFWRGTGELDAAIDDACDVLEISRESDESDEGREDA